MAVARFDAFFKDPLLKRDFRLAPFIGESNRHHRLMLPPPLLVLQAMGENPEFVFDNFAVKTADRMFHSIPIDHRASPGATGAEDRLRNEGS
jgi:hypothetical protein